MSDHERPKLSDFEPDPPPWWSWLLLAVLVVVVAVAGVGLHILFVKWAVSL